MLLCLFVLAAFAFAEDDPVFRADATYIAVDVQVLSQDRPVTGLRREDFIVRDEGQVQTVSTCGAEEQELDIVLLIDTSGSTQDIQAKLRAVAAEAMTHLHFRDRVGIAVFAEQAYRVIEPTWDWLAVHRALHSLHGAGGGTELNATLGQTAGYLRSVARPGARRSIVILTDNRGYRRAADTVVRNHLWECDVVVNALLFETPYRSGGADVRQFAAATGGDVLRYRQERLPLSEIFQRMRRRYLLLYPAPGGEPGSVRKIRVELTREARAGLKDLTIRARSGYVAGRPGSSARRSLAR